MTKAFERNPRILRFRISPSKRGSASLLMPMDTKKKQSSQEAYPKSGMEKSDACLENIEYHADRKLDKALITKLSTCQYIGERHNIMILGASGAGKTYLSCGFGMAACHNFYKLKYIRLPNLLIELAVARNDGSYRKVM